MSIIITTGDQSRFPYLDHHESNDNNGENLAMAATVECQISTKEFKQQNSFYGYQGYCILKGPSGTRRFSADGPC
jgi:hypothetical protein